MAFERIARIKVDGDRRWAAFDLRLALNAVVNGNCANGADKQRNKQRRAACSSHFLRDARALADAAAATTTTTTTTTMKTIIERRRFDDPVGRARARAAGKCALRTRLLACFILEDARAAIAAFWAAAAAAAAAAATVEIDVTRLAC